MTKDEALIKIATVNAMDYEYQAWAREALAQPEQKPVQFKCTVIDDAHPNGIPLEQWAKPQRTWVGLTDEEIWGAVSRIGTSDSDVNPYAILKDARAIEAKLKEKNT